MSRAQIWRVTVTPRERFRLSQVLINQALKFRRKDLRRLDTARAALALIGVTEVGIEHKRVNEKYGNDRTIRHRFSVSADTADFLLEQIEKVDLSGYEALVLAPLVGQLEAGKDADDADQVADLVEADELPSWKPEPRLPVVDDPEHFIEVLGKLLDQADGDLRRFATLYHDAMSPEEATSAN